MKIYKKGFTLIELLVVIAIIGLLSSIVLASLNSARQKGRDARRIADIKQLQLALELYYDANNVYPTSLSALTGPGYISVIPTDPLSNLGYAYTALQGLGTTVGACGAYHLGAKLEQTTGNSTLNTDSDGTVGGTYGSGASDGTVCTGGSWAGNADIPAASSDFSGADPVYDVKP